MSDELGNIRSALVKGMSKTFETLAFVEVMPLGEDAPIEAQEIDVVPRTEVIWAKIPLVHPHKGALVMMLSPALTRLLTEMIYGVFDPEEIEAEQMMDAVAEISNILAGRFSSEFLGKGADFELGLPKKGLVKTEAELPLSGAVKSIRLDYAVEGHLLSVVLMGDVVQNA